MSIKEDITKEMEQNIERAMYLLSVLYPKFKAKDSHNLNTPKRIVKMWLERFSGLGEMDFEFTVFPNEDENSNWVIKKDIEFSSMCQHHFMPFFGKVHIGYIPRDVICGISKLDRVVDYFSKRPQVQERFGSDIQHFLQEELDAKTVVVIVESLHTCVACRGIESRNSTMITTHSSNLNHLLTFKELIR